VRNSRSKAHYASDWCQGTFERIRHYPMTEAASAAILTEVRGGTPSGTDTDDVLANLAWSLIRDWRRRCDVDPVIRRAWVRLYVGVIQRVRG
jgi:hypothetical protein